MVSERVVMMVMVVVVGSFPPHFLPLIAILTSGPEQQNMSCDWEWEDNFWIDKRG